MSERALVEAESRFDAENRTETAFLDFQKAVHDARPDLTFTFDRGPSFQAKWTFPGARFGGSAMWLSGTRDLGWGMAQVDIDAWQTYEVSGGREPRWT